MGSRSPANLVGWLAVLVAGAASAGAAIAGATLASPPNDLRAAADTSAIAVGHDHFDDVRDVQLSVAGTAPAHLFSPGAGKVTAFACAQGATVSSGGSPLSLDGSPKLALATAMPLWRDLTPETRGEDVRALQDELNRLGFRLTSDGVMGHETREAAKAAFARIGVTLQSGGGVPAASIMWIPAATVGVSSCDASIGAEVQQGTALATFTSMSPKVTVIDLPSDLLPGERIVKVGDARFQADPNGDVHVPDVAALGVLAASDSPDSTAPISARIALGDPIAVSVVPPSAVYSVQGTDGCVASNGAPYRIHILGSQLGETLVEFTNAHTPARVDTPPKHHTSCR